MAEKLSVVMARKHLEAADVALILIDAAEGVTASDATIAGYAHESGRSVIIVINKWDLVTVNRTDGKPPAERAAYEEQVRRHLKFLSYAPVLFVSATTGKNVDKLFSTLELVARERRKRIGTGEMNRFLSACRFRARVGTDGEAGQDSLHDAGRRLAAHVHSVHRPRGEAALLVSAISGEPDSRRLRVCRHADLDQEPRAGKEGLSPGCFPLKRGTDVQSRGHQEGWGWPKITRTVSRAMSNSSSVGMA